MSDRQPYSRIYHSIVDDPKFATVYDDDRRLATWLRLLIVAEGAHPSSAYIPEGTNRGALAALVECGLVDIGTGRRFRIRGLDAERTRRSQAARVGGLASGRSRSGEQPLNERSTKSNLDETSIDKTSNTRASATNEWGPKQPRLSTVDRDPFMRKLREAIVEKNGVGMDEPTVKP
jgi:hypothetical protein